MMKWFDQDSMGDVAGGVFFFVFLLCTQGWDDAELLPHRVAWVISGVSFFLLSMAFNMGYLRVRVQLGRTADDERA